MALTYSRDMARYAVQAAIDLPTSELNQSVDIGSDIPATGVMVAEAFSRVLNRPIRAKPVYPRFVFTVLPYVARFIPRLRDNLSVLKWLRKGSYISRDPEQQREIFGDLPTVEETVTRYCRDKDLT